MSEPQIHSFETDALPEDHPLARQTVLCGGCGNMVHAFNNECMSPWVEWDKHVLCWDCALPFFAAHGINRERFAVTATRHDIHG